MLEIVLNKVSKNYGIKKVLKNINFEIKTNEKVALVGSNGSGKSTILKLIMNNEKADEGEVFIRKDAKIGILNQIPDINLNKYIVKEILYNSFKKINLIKEQLDKEERKLNTLKDEQLEKCIMKYSKLQEEYIRLGGYEVDSKIDKITAAFKIEKLLEMKYENLSGGEKTIINLISILLEENEIILLDEPTNHLDIDMIEWLENYLINCKKTLLIVSHDRYFLDKVTTKTILVDNGESEIFYGNYSYYIEENENRIMREFNQYKTQQKQIEAMKKSIKKLREFGQLAYPCGENFFKRAASIEKRLEKIEIINNPQTQNTIKLKFNVESRSGKDVIELKNYYLNIDNIELLKNVNLLIKYKERICLMGKNGTGKSTLVKEIINKGENIKVGSKVKIGYIPQDITFEDENITVLNEARKFFIGSENILRSALIKFMFYSEGIYIKLNKLSGGERLRLKLFCLIQQDTNLLILDEPTNHIDINTKEVLEEALINYNGTVLLISHDRYFINKIATRIIRIENKKINSYIGNYDDYKNELKNVN